MKQGIPKSVQDLLARQTAADEHPSADLLNGYMEQSLAANERTQVTKHLAACGECREIVFLANSVQEEEVAPVAAAAMPAQERQVVAPGGRRKSSWAWWKWAAPAVAVIVVAAGVVLQWDRIPQRPHPKRDTLALNTAPSAAATNQENAVILNPPAEPAARAKQAAPTESKKRAAANASQSADQVRRIEQQQPPQKSVEVAQVSPPPEKPRPSAAAGAVAAVPAAPRANPTLSLVSGDLTGTVTDPSGAVVPNATVSLKNNGTGQTRTTTANNTGSYRFSLLQPGTYTVSATASGFSKAETTAMVNVGQATGGDVKLPVGSSSQTVEITSAAPLVQADSADLSTNFNQNVVANAPNGGNDLTYAPKTAPAVGSAVGGAVGGKDQTAAASLKSGLVSSGQPAAVNKLAKAELPRAHWRITADGHLERALPGSAWTRVLADQPIAFRVVATIGSNVWAGGNGGALFHSTDQGETWNRVALNMNRQAERSAIVSIHFDNAVQGSVTTDSGATWVTSDGGQTWIKR
jgi:hypothetical protein